MRKMFFRVLCFLLSMTLTKARPQIDDLFSSSSFIDKLSGCYDGNKKSYGASDGGYIPYIKTFNVPSFESGCYTPGCRGRYRKPIKSSTNAPTYTLPTSSYDYRPRPEPQPASALDSRPRPEPAQTLSYDYRPQPEPVPASAYEYTRSEPQPSPAYDNRPQPADSFSYLSQNWCRKLCKGWNGICNKCRGLELYECPAGCYPS